jgi:hypothetical protein
MTKATAASSSSISPETASGHLSDRRAGSAFRLARQKLAESRETSTTLRGAMAALEKAALLGAAVSLAGCYSPGNGVTPPLDKIYFPVGIAVSPGETRMYVANSDFDLQYNSGSLQAYDLVRLRSLLPEYCNSDSDCDASARCDLTPTQQNGDEPSHWCVARSGAYAGKPCGALGEKQAADRFLEPGRCNYVDPVHPKDGGSSLILGAVGIGAFATDVIFVSRPPAPDTGQVQPGGRLFVPVRGDATLHWVDVDDDSKVDKHGNPIHANLRHVLECGQDNNGGQCDSAHRRGDDSDQENTRGLRMPPEPFAIAATPTGSAIVVTAQTDGDVSLFVNDAQSWGDGVTSFGTGPDLAFIETGLPANPVGVAYVPEPELVRDDPTINYQPGFLVTFRDAAELHLLRYYDDSYVPEENGNDPNNPARPFISQSAVVNITSNAQGFDSRGIAIDSSDRSACEARCDATYSSGTDQLTQCLSQCAGIPLGVYVANRTPASLLVGHTQTSATGTSSNDLPEIVSVVPMPYGPSRVVVGSVIGLDGTRQTRVFVVCFDSRRIGVYDPDGQVIDAWIDTGRGPYAFATDIGPQVQVASSPAPPTYAYGYIGHFTDSYVGVVDLDERHTTFGQIIMTLGKPTAPRTSN